MLKNSTFSLINKIFSNACYYSSLFKSSDIIINKTKSLKQKPENCDNVGFGTVFTDHMLQINWTSKSGWHKPLIKPIENFSLHPAALVFHYAPEIFDGLKAFYGEDNVVRMFRPDMNMNRFKRSAKRAMLPDFDANELLECTRQLISVDKGWVPKKRGHSLYIRPTLIGVDPKLGVASASEAILYVLLCPVGAYYPTGFKPVSLMANPSYVRAWPGGTGDCKMGSNYAPTIYVANEAHKNDCQQVLWLFGEEEWLSEVGTMNIFVYLINEQGQKEVITPPLNGTILPGVTRDSLLQLLREENQVKVSEREISMKELIKALQDGRLKEMFGSGTACVVSPVERINYKGTSYSIPTMENGAPLTMKMLQQLNDIQYGSTIRSEWSVSIP